MGSNLILNKEYVTEVENEVNKEDNISLGLKWDYPKIELKDKFYKGKRVIIYNDYSGNHPFINSNFDPVFNFDSDIYEICVKCTATNIINFINKVLSKYEL